MQTRRLFMRCFAAAASGLAVLGLLPAGLSAGQGSDAATFLTSLKDEAIAELTDSSIPEEERKERFRALFRENFDLAAIGRFVLGRYWRAASEDERQEFLAVFEDVMVERFAPEFAGYGDTAFEVSTVRQLEEQGQFVVSTAIKPPQGETYQVDWRVRQGDGGFKILDVIAQGVSMALTLRSEYAAVIKKGGGKVDNLIAMLRERVQNAG